MPSSKRAVPKRRALPTYKIFLDGVVRRGTARELLEAIRADAARRSDLIAGMDVRRYAAILIDSGRDQLDADFLTHLRKEDYASDYDRALRYLTEMEAGGVRILSQSAARGD